MRMTRAAMMAAVAALAQADCAGETSADIVIYGSSPAAIAAAVQAKRMGAKAVVVSPETRIGGMTTGCFSIIRDFAAMENDWRKARGIRGQAISCVLPPFILEYVEVDRVEIANRK